MHLNKKIILIVRFFAIFSLNMRLASYFFSIENYEYCFFAKN